MTNIDRLRNIVELIKQKIESTSYKENDVRKAYYENLYSILNEFYIGKVFFELSSQIKEGNIKFTPEIYHLKNHILRIYEIADHPLLSDSYHNDLNRKIFADSFTNFESTIDLCVDSLIEEKQRNRIIEEINSKILKLFPNDSDNKDVFFQHLKKITYIPLLRKFKYLAKYKENCYGENYHSDIEFIEFSAKLRNCVSHSGGYYKGNNYEYEFEGVKFIFKNGEFLEMQGNNEFVFVKLNERLTNIIDRLFNCLKDINFIKYPDDGF